MENLEQEIQVTINPAQWSAEVAMWLTLSLQWATIADLREQVDNGAQVFSVEHEGRMVGAFVLRLDKTAQGMEGVVVAAGGRLPGFDFTFDLLPHVEKMFLGVAGVRIHTARAGMAKKLLKLGYEGKEMVFFKRLKK